jgi:hypothetical protein
MKIGIFAKTFSRPTIEDLFGAIAVYEIYSAQFNLSCVGLETLPTNVPDALARRVIGAAEHAKVELPAMSGTFNRVFWISTITFAISGKVDLPVLLLCMDYRRKRLRSPAISSVEVSRSRVLLLRSIASNLRDFNGTGPTPFSSYGRDFDGCGHFIASCCASARGRARPNISSPSVDYRIRPC